ncbi:molybdate transport system substrate-binding protein [Streptacidiphilus sp. MAP12-33]|uniref:substrate-binding domain-containing protein n=1 Tax=Streptacidiphilus sp. MAP12-33 TaxID=3156266 RepID=UPI003510F27F
MEQEISGLSSMATRLLLAELSERLRLTHALPVRFDSAGGVDIARRVRAGAAADVLVLADDALAALAAEGHVRADTVRPLWVSQVVAAVPAGAPAPALATEADLRAALLTAQHIAYSTGPSGTAVLDLITRLGLTDQLTDRLLQAPPGVPVGTLLASGAADLAFQQHSELMNLPAVTILGPLPGTTAIESTFSGAVLTTSARPSRAADLLTLLTSAASARTAHSHGMRAAA